MSARSANFLLPEDMFPDFSAVAVTEDEANTTLFSLSSLRTDYVVLVYLPTVTMVGELLALRDNLHNFTQVRQQQCFKHKQACKDDCFSLLGQNSQCKHIALGWKNPFCFKIRNN
jgi:hypothetical protein